MIKEDEKTKIEVTHYRLIVLHQVLWLLCTRGLLKCKTKGVRFYI